MRWQQVALTAGIVMVLALALQADQGGPQPGEAPAQGGARPGGARGAAPAGPAGHSRGDATPEPDPEPVIGLPAVAPAPTPGRKGLGQ